MLQRPSINKYQRVVFPVMSFHGRFQKRHGISHLSFYLHHLHSYKVSSYNIQWLTRLINCLTDVGSLYFCAVLSIRIYILCLAVVETQIVGLKTCTLLYILAFTYLIIMRKFLSEVCDSSSVFLVSMLYYNWKCFADVG